MSLCGCPQRAKGIHSNACYHPNQWVRVEIQKSNSGETCGFSQTLISGGKRKKKQKNLPKNPKNNKPKSQPTTQQVEKTQKKWCKTALHYLVQADQPVFKQWLHRKDQTTFFYGCTTCCVVWNIPLIGLGDLALLCPSLSCDLLQPSPWCGRMSKVLTLSKGRLDKSWH